GAGGHACPIESRLVARHVREGRASPGVVLRWSADLGEADGPVRIALIERAAGGVVDGEQLPEDEEIPQRPRRHGEQESEESRSGEVPPRPHGIAAIPERSEEKSPEEEPGRPRQSGERRDQSGGDREVRRGTVHGGEKEEARGEEQEQEERLALDV